MSEENCIRVTVTEDGKPIQKIIVGMNLSDIENGYEVKGVITVDYKRFTVLKSFPEQVLHLVVFQPSYKVGESIKLSGQLVTVKSISVNYNGFVYCGFSSTGHTCISQSQLPITPKANSL